MRTHTKLIVITGMMVAQPLRADLIPKSHIGIAGIDFQMQVGLNAGYVDNVAWQPRNNDAVGSDFQSVMPVFKVIGERYQDTYLLVYSGDYRRYGSDPADNYRDHVFRFDGTWRYGRMHAIRLNVSDVFGHEARGRGITEGFLPGQFRAFGIGSPLGTTLSSSELRYSYGSPEGRGKAEVALLFKKHRFGNTDNAKNSDIDFYHYLLDQAWHENSLIVELFDQYSAETRFRYSFFTNQRRHNVNPRKDSNEYYLAYGIKSRLTGKTSIDANVARLYKTFANNANAQRFNGFNWDVQAEWKPRKQAMLTAYSSQHIKDPSDAGGYVQVSRYGVSWQHFWLVDRLSTTFDYSYTTEGYKKQAKNRRDKNRLLTFTMRYDFRPSMHFELKYQRDMLRSNKDIDAFFIGPDGSRQVLRTLGYDNSLIMFTAKVQI